MPSRAAHRSEGSPLNTPTLGGAAFSWASSCCMQKQVSSASYAASDAASEPPDDSASLATIAIPTRSVPLTDSRKCASQQNPSTFSCPFASILFLCGLLHPSFSHLVPGIGTSRFFAVSGCLLPPPFAAVPFAAADLVTRLSAAPLPSAE